MLEIAFVVGEMLNHTLSVCLEKQDAIEIVTADQEKGRAEAERVWNAKDRCGNVPVVGHFVGKVVFILKDSKVVEIRHAKDGSVIGYFVTKDDITKAKGARHIQGAA